MVTLPKFKKSPNPTDVRVSREGQGGFKGIYGQNFYSAPFKNLDRYKKQEDVLKAVALGEIGEAYGATVLRDKFGLTGMVGGQTIPSAQKKFKNMVSSYVNENPMVQQQYEDLIYHAGLIRQTSGRYVPSGKAQRIEKAAYINRAIDKAMDPTYLKEYGDVPFRFKYINALKDIVDPKASIQAIGASTYSNAFDAGESIANARGLNLKFRPDKTVENKAAGVTGKYFKIDDFVTVNNDRVILPRSLFPADEVTLVD